MLSKVLKVVILIAMISGLAYFGLCTYANCIDPLQQSKPQIDLPEVEAAPYMLTIESTGNTLFTDDYREVGNFVVVKGYWELVGREFKYRQQELVLDREVFGEIKISKRQ